MPTAPSLDQRFVLTDEQAGSLAQEFGTPLYVLDEEHLRRRVARFVRSWQGDVSFASKANFCGTVMKIAESEGCTIDVAGEGELRIALAAGVPASKCRLHGSNKSIDELKLAVNAQVGQIIVDCFEEIERLKAFTAWPDLLLRVAPAVDPKTHAKISTGQADTKFGFPMADVESAVRACLDAGMPLKGLHCHVGSQLLDPSAQIAGARALASLALQLQSKLGFVCRVVNIGGGLGVRYTAADNPTEIEEYCAATMAAVRDELDGRLDPELGMEPGRSMVAESGVTLYRVGAVKRSASGRVYVSVDGGLSDNPRPALYGAKYDLDWVGKADRSQTVTVSGKHCETDTLFADVAAPCDVKAGDLVQVLCTGAYNMVMANNYNGNLRAATVLLRSGGPCVVQERETWDQLLARERVPEGL